MQLVLPIENDVASTLPIFLVTAGVNHEQKPMKREKGANFHHFLFIAEGDAFFNFNGKKEVVKQGNTVFMKKNVPVDYCAFGKSLKTFWVTFDGSSCEGIFEYFSIEDFAVIEYKNTKDRIEEIYKLAKSARGYHELSHEIYEFVIDFFSAIKRNSDSPILTRAKEYVMKNYDKDISVQQISSACNVSQSLLFKLFKQDGTTPVEFLTQTRISVAKKMLINGKSLVYDVAKACGFSSVAYFCKVFKTQTGETPLSYKSKFEV